jgi:hypothetical protein
MLQHCSQNSSLRTSIFWSDSKVICGSPREFPLYSEVPGHVICRESEITFSRHEHVRDQYWVMSKGINTVYTPIAISCFARVSIGSNSSTRVDLENSFMEVNERENSFWRKMETMLVRVHKIKQSTLRAYRKHIGVRQSFMRFQNPLDSLSRHNIDVHMTKVYSQASIQPKTFVYHCGQNDVRHESDLFVRTVSRNAIGCLKRGARGFH